MSRLFTFGCSFTRYNWPTWADILATQHDSFSNWGCAGAGNFYIFNSLIECIERNQINKDDTVGIMWSSIAREDRYVNGHWLFTGSIYTQRIYEPDFVEKFADPTGYLLRDLSYISAARQILDSIGCRYYFFSLVPLACFEDFYEKFFGLDKKILRVYQKDVDSILPSIYETVFKNNWHSRVGFRDWQTLKKNYAECCGASWPKDWDVFFSMYENNELGLLELEILDDYDFRFKLIRTDYHATPAEHLEYVKTVLPDLELDCDDWIEEVQQRVLDQTWVNFEHNNTRPTRF